MQPIGGSAYLRELTAPVRIRIRDRSASPFGRINLSGAAPSRDRAGSSVVRDATQELNALVVQLRQLAAERAQYSDVPRSASSQTNAVRKVWRTVANGPNTVEGVNSSQVSALSVSPLRAGHQLQLSGTVTQAAEAATVTIVGDALARTTAGGVYRLTGGSGSVVLELENGEALSDVAERINAAIADTGVTATVVGTDLHLATTGAGSDESIRFETIEPGGQNQASYNAAQVADVAILAHQAGATETLTGSVTAATTGELTYHGAAGGVAAGTASFRLTGNSGAVTVSIASGESLSAVAERINLETNTTGVTAELAGDDLRFVTTATGSTASVQIDNIEPEYATTIGGLNGSQIADLEVLSIDNGAEVVLSGSVSQSATGAVVSLAGSAGAIIDSATYSLRGDLGTVSLDVFAGEALTRAAGRVNDQSGSTGVVATVVGDSLQFVSTAVGSNAVVDVSLTDITHTNSYSGVNGGQLSSFAINSLVKGASETLSGTIDTAATHAQLTHTGSLGLVGQTSTFTLTGNLGSRNFSTSSLQSLSNLASDINSQSANTGVTASVQGNTLTFASSGYGSSATVSIVVNSGSFSVSGGNGDGTANGADATATINGESITAATNTFTYSDGLGSFTFETVQGFTGALSPIEVVSTPGSFVLTGGDGHGSGYGTDAVATINGFELTGTGNRFEVATEGGSFELEFASGFTGAFDSVTVSSVADAFDVTGGDVSGAAFGNDATAVINGSLVTEADNAFMVTTGVGQYALTFAQGFAGSFDAVVIDSTIGEVEVVGADENGTDFGVDAEAEINGTAYVADGEGVISVSPSVPEIAIAFQDGFAGEFDSITVTRPSRRVRRTVKPQQTGSSDSSRGGLARLDSRINAIQNQIRALEESLRTLNSLRGTAAYAIASRQTSALLSGSKVDLRAF